MKGTTDPPQIPVLMYCLDIAGKIFLIRINVKFYLDLVDFRVTRKPLFFGRSNILFLAKPVQSSSKERRERREIYRFT